MTSSRSFFDSLDAVAGRGGPRQSSALADVLSRTERLAPAELERHQLLRVAALVDHARRTVPFYRTLPDPPEGEPSRAWLSTLPILRREDVRERARDLVSERPPRGHATVREANSSGSTGRHVTVQVGAMSDAVGLALSLRDAAWHRRDPREKGASIRAVSDGARAPEGRTLERWLPLPESGPGAILDVHTVPREQLAWLVRQNPAYLATYPSNAMALLDVAAREGISWPALRELGTFGEVLPEGLRDACTRTWGVPVVDAYSCVEIGYLALECSLGGCYHVQSENVLLEVLGDDDAPCGVGETGRVVVTALHAFAMPLVRYAIGDHATVGAPCACGRGLPVLERILGRARNTIVLPSGERIWPRFGSNVLGGLFPIRQFRLRQTTVSELVLELVADRRLSEVDEDRLRRFVLTTLRHPFELALRYVDSIPRSPGGKFEDVISEIA